MERQMDNSEKIITELQQIKKLLAFQIVDLEKSTKDNVRTLFRIGLEPGTIAEILGIKPNAVHANLSQIKKEGQKKTKEKK